MKNPFAASRTLLAIVGLGACISAFAQGPHVGIKAGVNLSNLYNSEVNDDNARVGFDAGVFGRSAPDQPIGLQAELLYTTRGNKTNYSGFAGLVDQNVNFKLAYLELPVMISIRLAGGAFEIQAGGYAAYLLNAKVSTDGDLGSGNQDLNKDNFNSIDAGLVGGIAFNAGPIQLGARYDYGLTKIANSDEAKTLLGNAKNSCAQLYLAVGMP